jgi:type II secretory pathway predicted ATPase ExeA
VEARDGAMLFVLMVAQPSLRETLARPGYESLAQRIVARPRIDPFTMDESVGYLRHQVRKAGGEPARVFDDSAVAILAEACSGIARVLNQAAGLAIDLAIEGETDAVDAEAALEALTQLGLNSVEPANDLVVLPHPKRAIGSMRAAQSKGRGAKEKTTRKRTA